LLSMASLLTATEAQPADRSVQNHIAEITEAEVRRFFMLRFLTG
jgi:hypothetical protein